MSVTSQAADEALTATTGVSFVTLPAVKVPLPEEVTNDSDARS